MATVPLWDNARRTPSRMPRPRAGSFTGTAVGSRSLVQPGSPASCRTGTMTDREIAQQELLSEAASRGDLIALRHLLTDLQVPADSPDPYGVTPLMEACRGGRLPAAVLLVECGANVNATDKEKNT